MGLRMLSETIRKRYVELKCDGQRCVKSGEEKRTRDLAAAEYMKRLIDGGEVKEFEDIGFCLWNISDSFALLRDCESEYHNHVEFADFVSRGESKYKFWTVCDATQRFTLIKGGYEGFWQDLYKDAAENSYLSEENYRIAYEANRAAMAVHPALKISEDFLLYADKKFSEFLEKNKNREEYGFYRLIYSSAAMKAFGKTELDIEELCSDFFDKLRREDTPCVFLLGEWGQLNRHRSERNRASVGIAAAVNALIDTGETARAKRLYEEAKSYGLTENAYINKRIGEDNVL